MDQQPQPSSDPLPAAPPTTSGAAARRDPNAPPRRPAPEVTVPPEPRSPFLYVWFKPRAVMRARLIAPPVQWMFLFPIITSLIKALDRASDRNLGDRIEFPMILLTTLCLSVLFGVLGTYIAAFVLHAVGRWFGGRGTRAELRAAICWGSLPLAVIGTALWAPFAIVYGPEIFKSEPDVRITSEAVWTLFEWLPWIAIVLRVWCFVLSTKMLAEAHRFSAWRALGAIVVSGLLFLGALVGPLALIVLVGAFFR